MNAALFKTSLLVALATLISALPCSALDNLEPSIELNRAGDSSAFLSELPATCELLVTELLGVCCPSETAQGIIDYTLASPQKVGLSVYDQQGHEVVHLVNDTIVSGHHRALWDGCSKNGDVVADGTYFLLMKTEEFVKLRKMVLVR